MAILITSLGANKPVKIEDTEKNSVSYFQPAITIAQKNILPTDSILITDGNKNLYVKFSDVNTPAGPWTAETLALHLNTNFFYDASSGGGASITGYNLETTQQLVEGKLTAANAIHANSYGSLLMSEGHLLEIKEANEAANDTLSGAQPSVTTTSVQVLNPVGCKGFKIYNNTNGNVYIRIGTGVLIRSGATANYTLIMEPGDYYESQPYERDFPISYAAGGTLTGQLMIAQYFKNP